jgi:hypothetical protein
VYPVALDWERDWPIALAAVAAVAAIAIYVLAGRESTNKSVILGGGTASADYQAQVGAQTALAQSRMQAYSQLAGTLVGAGVQLEQVKAATAATELQAATTRAQLAAQTDQVRIAANAQLAAAQAQAHAQQQQSTLGFLASIVPAIFSIFCEEVTGRAVQSRGERNQRFHAAYPALAG